MFVVKKGNKFTDILLLFLTFLKVGAFTFGGGYAMIPIIQREVVDKRKWVSNTDILDIIAISESTPGPIAVNAATFIGFKVGGFFGSLFATLGLALPSFVIIYIISFFYKTFMEWTLVQAAFKGLSIGVIILLFNAFFKLKKVVKTDVLGIILFIIVLIAMLTLNLFQVKVPMITLIFIVSGLLVGIIATLLSRKEKQK